MFVKNETNQATYPIHNMHADIADTKYRMHATSHGFDLLVDEGDYIPDGSIASFAAAYDIPETPNLLHCRGTNRTILDANRGQFIIFERNDNILAFYPNHCRDQSR